MRLLPPSSRAVAALLLAAARTHAAGADVAAPVDFLDSPAVIGQGRWAFDPVFPTLRSLDERGGSRLVSRPGALNLAVGVGKTLELRAAARSPTDGLAMESATDRVRRLHGFSDVSLGARWCVRGGDAGWLPGVAWLADVETTMGSPAFRGRAFRPSLRATAEWELPYRFSLGVMPGLYRDRGDHGRHYAAAVLAVTLGKAWTPRLQTFVELAGQRLSRAQSDGSLLNVDTGMAYVVSKTLQVDMVVSRSLSGNAAQEVRGGLSVSSRF